MIGLKNEKYNTVYTFESNDEANNFCESYYEPNELFAVPIYYSDGSGWNGKRSGVCYGNDKRGYALRWTNTKLTNNEAEYEALFECCKVCPNDSHIIIDSKLIANQISGTWRINSKRFDTMVKRIRQLIGQKGLTIEWMLRENNKAGKYIETAQRK